MENENFDLVREFRLDPMLARKFVEGHDSRSIDDRIFVFVGKFLKVTLGTRVTKIILGI